MITTLFTVAKQVFLLFILVFVGFLLGKLQLITKKGSLSFSNLILYVVSPCMTISAFQREYDSSITKDYIFIGLFGLVIFAITIGLSYVIVREKSPERASILRHSIVFSNCGFMGYPLLNALLGTIGVFYGNAYVIVFNIIQWTWGIYNMSGGTEKINLKKALINPGMIGGAIAILLYAARITLPSMIATPVTYLANMNTPLPMIVIGYQLSQCNLKDVVKDHHCWIAVITRLILVPGIVLLICLVLKINSTLGIVLMIASATPAAASISLLSEKYGKDTSLASSLLSFETLLSILTLPVMVTIAKTFLIF